MYDKVDQLKEYSGFIVENAYMKEIESFFNAMNNFVEPSYGFKEDKIILEIIDRIED